MVGVGCWLLDGEFFLPRITRMHTDKERDDYIYTLSSVRLKVVEGQLVRVIAARTAVIRFCK